MASESRVIICVGSPGNGRDDILNEMRELTNFNYYHLFEYIVEEARLDDTNLTKLNILDFYDSSPEKMENYHKSAIRKASHCRHFLVPCCVGIYVELLSSPVDLLRQNNTRMKCQKEREEHQGHKRSSRVHLVLLDSGKSSSDKPGIEGGA